MINAFNKCGDRDAIASGNGIETNLSKKKRRIEKKEEKKRNNAQYVCTENANILRTVISVRQYSGRVLESNQKRN